ncbi:MAG: carboxylating nicotinate-nucleotide diphosphorylase, partial [Pseudomonadota bacterium]
EDVGSGDKTTALLVDPELPGQARVFAKETLVAAGFLPFLKVFQLLTPHIDCRFLAKEGALVSAGETLIELAGPFHALLTGERTALNFLQRLSGIATATHYFAEKIKPFGTVLLDTRKTAPGWRMLEKEAVRLGGGTNHRMGLFDAVLIKENHSAACGGITKAIEKIRESKSPHLMIEVEVRNLDELEQALEARPDVIMLDNMSCDAMRKAVEITGGSVRLEASGNVTLDTIEEIASTGVTYISSGAITHSARAVDLSMLIERTAQ